MTATLILVSLMALCLTSSWSKHLGEERTIDAPPIAELSNQTLATSQENHGFVRDFQTGDIFFEVGTNSVQLAECLALQDLICNISTSNSTAYDGHTVITETRSSNSARQFTFAISQSLGAFLSLSQLYFGLMKPLFTAAILSAGCLTPAQITLLSGIGTDGQTLLYTTLPAAITMLAFNPILTPAQIQQVNSALDEGIRVNGNTQLIVDSLASVLNLTPSQIQAVGDISTALGGYYTTMKAIFADPVNQPSPTAAQIASLQTSLNSITSLITAAGTTFSGVTTPTTTVSTTTTTPAPGSLAWMGQAISAYHAAGQILYGLFQPLLFAAAAQTNQLTPAQKLQIQNIGILTPPFMSGLQNLGTLLSSSPSTLTPSQILQAQATLDQGIALLESSAAMNAEIAPLLNLGTSIQQSVDTLNTQGLNFLRTLRAIFADPISQPVVTPAQISNIQSSLTQLQTLTNTLGSILTTTTTSTTTTTTTTVSPLPLLAQLLQSAEEITRLSENLFIPMITSANPQSLTLTEASQLEGILTTLKGLREFTMPDIIEMVSTNPTLTPAQLEEVKDAVALKITTLTASVGLLHQIASKLGLNAGQLATTIDVLNDGVDFYSALLPFVNKPSIQPTFSTSQLNRLQNILTHARGVLTSAGNTLTSTSKATPSATTTKPFTRWTTFRPWHTHHSTSWPNNYPTTPSWPPHHGYHHHHRPKMSPFEKLMISFRIQGIVAEMQSLLTLVREPSSARSLDAAQPLTVIERLLTLRSRQPEIDERLRTMSEQDQKDIDSKLEAAQDQLHKLVADRSELKHYLTKTKGSELLLTVFLNKMEDTLDPFL